MKTESIRYVCDMTGKECEPMSNTEHSATLRFDFGYGSKLDGARGNPVIVRVRFSSGVTHFVVIAGKEALGPQKTGLKIRREVPRL